MLSESSRFLCLSFLSRTAPILMISLVSRNVLVELRESLSEWSAVTGELLSLARLHKALFWFCHSAFLPCVGRMLGRSRSVPTTPVLPQGLTAKRFFLLTIPVLSSQCGSQMLHLVRQYISLCWPTMRSSPLSHLFFSIDVDNLVWPIVSHGNLYICPPPLTLTLSALTSRVHHSLPRSSHSSPTVLCQFHSITRQIPHHENKPSHLRHQGRNR